MSAAPRIEFERSGGFAGLSVRTSVRPEDPDAASWAELVGGLDLAALPAPPAAPAGGADRFSYRLVVEVAGRRYDLQYAEQSLPAQLRDLVDRLSARARRTG